MCSFIHARFYLKARASPIFLQVGTDTYIQTDMIPLTLFCRPHEISSICDVRCVVFTVRRVVCHVEQRTTNDERRTTKRTTNDERRTTNDERQTTNDEEGTTNPATVNLLQY